MKTLQDKILITGELELLTGMHIGKSNDFAPIGAVDSVVIKDLLTGKPIIPGSTLKGKMRTLLAKIKTKNSDYVLPKHEKDEEEIKNLFGNSQGEIKESRLQFYDLSLTDESAKNLYSKDLDLAYTEIKFENNIDRTTAVANPRQLERVPAGAKFGFKLIYNYLADADLEEDFQLIADGFKMLQLDYIGGSGTRGYGKIKFNNLSATSKKVNGEEVDVTEINELLKEVEGYGV